MVSNWKLRGPVLDGMTYQSDVLQTWRVFWVPGVKTALTKATTWWMMLRLLGVSLSIAVLLVMTVPNPALLKSSKFREIGNFLQIFVCFMLAFFLASSVSRWFACTNGFLQVFDAIRNFHMQLHALGVPPHRRTQIARYGVISAYLLYMELKIGVMNDEREAMEATRQMWEDMIHGSFGTDTASFGTDSDNKHTRTSQDGSDPMKKYMMILPEEEEMLLQVEDPAAVIWVWVASIVGRLAQDGDIPPMPSPTYGRIMAHAEAAHHGIRNIKASIQVRAPFIYVHMLAAIVHINNVVNAVTFGIIIGSLVGTLLMYFPFLARYVQYKERSSREDVILDAENFVVTIFINMVGPLIYQTLLDVSISIAEPFNAKETNIPVQRLLECVVKDLIDRDTLATNPPSWEVPYYKTKPSPA